MQMFDGVVTLNQFWWTNQFTAGSIAGSGIFMLGPPTSSGLFLSTSTSPVALQPGLVSQAFFSTTRSTPGSLDAPNCRPSQGAFFVHEVGYAPDGSLTKLAADFSAQCSLGYAAYVQGGIRYGSSLAAALDRTIAVPGLDRSVNEGQALVLDGSLSWNPSRRLTSLDWVQISGPAFDLSNCKLGVCNTYTPKVDKGGAVAVFRLTASAGFGQVATGDLRIKVQSWQDTQSRVDVWGKGYIAGGVDLSLSDTDGQFEVPIKDGSESVYADQTPERMEWRFYPNGNGTSLAVTAPQFVLSTAAGTSLTPGTYSGALRAGFVPGSAPAAAFSFNGHECNTPSWTSLVAAMDRNPTDLTLVNSGAVTFAVRCLEGGAEPNASYGRFWIRYSPVSPPIVKIASPANVQAGQTFTIMDAGSTTPAAPSWLQTCKQVFGLGQADISFAPDGTCQVRPSVTTPDKSKLVVRYEIIDELGQTGVALAEVTVTGGPAAGSSSASGQRQVARVGAFRQVGR